MAEMPLGFTVAMNNGGQKDILCVKNYDTGASMTEAYTDFEQLDEILRSAPDLDRTDSSGTDPSCALRRPGGQHQLSSHRQGPHRLAVRRSSATINGRHPLIGRSVEDLTGVFSIEKFIQLWSGSQPGEISVDWLPCS